VVRRAGAFVAPTTWLTFHPAFHLTDRSYNAAVKFIASLTFCIPHRHYARSPQSAVRLTLSHEPQQMFGWNEPALASDERTQRNSEFMIWEVINAAKQVA
jgi:hypothetical protein